MFNVGPLTFHLYGLMIGLGILAGAYAASREDKRVWDALTWALVGGIIGARLYHVIDLWQFYRLNPGEILAVWHGGMGIYGGILGGIVGLWFWESIRSLKIAKKLKSKGYSPFEIIRKNDFLKLLDASALGLPLGQAIGRWGNYFNQELYGLPSNLPWAIYIKPENRLLAVWEFEYFHPLFLYESLWCLVIFMILLKLVRKHRLVVYLGLYGLGRFFLEFLRLEPWTINGINVAQLISLGLILGSVGFLIKRK